MSSRRAPRQGRAGEEHLSALYGEIGTFFESAAPGGTSGNAARPHRSGNLHLLSSIRPPNPLCVLPLRPTIARVHARKSPETPARHDNKCYKNIKVGPCAGTDAGHPSEGCPTPSGDRRPSLHGAREGEGASEQGCLAAGATPRMCSAQGGIESFSRRGEGG